jgi:REP element-mobilizing transposase RayT
MAYYERKLPRLSGYDYSQNGYYFVTICACQKRHLFGSVHQQFVILNDIGKIVKNEILQIPRRLRGVNIDAFSIMPNHLHSIVVIEKDEQGNKSPTLSGIIALYKAGVSRQIHSVYPHITVWQKSFYDRILRDDTAYLEVLRYIEENPKKWESDEYY